MTHHTEILAGRDIDALLLFFTPTRSFSGWYVLSLSNLNIPRFRCIWSRSALCSRRHQIFPFSCFASTLPYYSTWIGSGVLPVLSTALFLISGSTAMANQAKHALSILPRKSAP